MATFSSSELLRSTDAPVLVIHGRDDDEVPFHNAEEIVAAHPSARLIGFEGLGHRNVLFAPPVFRAVMHELSPKRKDAPPARRSGAKPKRERELLHSA